MTHSGRRGFSAGVLVALAAIQAAHVTAGASVIRIAAAADLQAILPTLVDRFQQSTGTTATVTFGSSGNFFSQIQNGAPFDLFFSADIDYPRRLEAAGLAEPGSLVTYAIGRIVVWSRRGSADVRGLDSLLDPRVQRIAIANPEHAPYGRAAVAALQHEHVYDRVRSKLVLGENVSQAAQFVDSGNADVGIIPLALAVAPALKDHGIYYEIPASFAAPIEQGAVVLKRSGNKRAAREFLAFVRTPDVVRLMQSAGFAPPPVGSER